MFVEERHQEILHLLQENEKVKVKELSKRFEVTEDCIRKDLASMEAKNLLKRTYGGAVLPDTLHPGHTNLVSTRKDKNIKQKQRMIAKKAVELIRRWRYDLSWTPPQQTSNWRREIQRTGDLRSYS